MWEQYLAVHTHALETSVGKMYRYYIGHCRPPKPIGLLNNNIDLSPFFVTNCIIIL